MVFPSPSFWDEVPPFICLGDRSQLTSLRPVLDANFLFFSYETQVRQKLSFCFLTLLIIIQTSYWRQKGNYWFYFHKVLRTVNIIDVENKGQLPGTKDRMINYSFMIIDSNSYKEIFVKLVVSDECTILWLHLKPLSGKLIMLKMVILCYVYFTIIKSFGGNTPVKAAKDKRSIETI